MGASTGQGLGVQWRQNVDPGEAAFNVAASYVADGGEGAKSDQGLGMFGDDTDGLFLSQLGYGNRKWYISGLYAYKHGSDGSSPAMGYSTPAASSYDASLHAFAGIGLLANLASSLPSVVATTSGSLMPMLVAQRRK